MNRIASIGDQILLAQQKLGLKNPALFSEGINREEFEKIKEFSTLGADNELQQLFTWRNGTAKNIPMKDLWIIPGFYFLPIHESIWLNKYLTDSLTDYSTSWYPLTSSGSADHHFVDIAKAASGKMPVFFDDPEGVPKFDQAFDSIEAMFLSFLAGYERNAFFVGTEGCLNIDYKTYVQINREFNPKSEHWWRKDLF